MKKFLAIILALLMVLSFASLAACGEKEVEKEETKVENNVETEEGEEGIDLENSENNEYVFEKIEAGMEVQIAMLGQSNNYFVTEQLLQGGIALLEPYGFKCQLITAEDASIASQIAQIENLITADEVAGMCVQTLDPESLETVITQAQDNNITVVVYGIECSYDTIVAMADVHGAGWGAGVMASAWVDAKYPDAGEGDIHVAVLGGQTNAPNKILTAAMVEYVENEDPRFVMGYYGDNEGDTVEHGLLGAEAALMVDPEIRVWLVYQMSAALSVNNYLEAQGLDMTEHGIFATSEDDTTAGLLEAAANGEAAFRGTICAGAGVPNTMVDSLIAAFKGEIEIGTLIIDPMYAMISSDYECDYRIGNWAE